MVKLLGPNWKSTLAGILSFLTITLTTVTAWIATMPQTVTASKITGGISLLLALLRAWIGFITKDAGSQLAVPPGGTTPELVASHEVPNDPAAKPVVPKE